MSTFCSNEVVGQVVIRDSVTIGLSSQIGKMVTAADTLVIEADGILTVRYDSAKSAIVQIWQDADLTVTKNDSVFQVDTVRSRFGDPDVKSYFCEGEGFNTYFEYSPIVEPPASAAAKMQASASEWIVGPVSEGDRIAFDYQGDRTGEYMTGFFPSEQDSSFLGGLWRCFVSPPGVNFYTDAIFFTVRVLPDTLQLEFDPAADSFVPVPDSVIEVTARINGVPTTGSVVFELEPHHYPSTFLLQDTAIVFESDRTVSPKTISVDGDSAVVEIFSTEYWGVVDVTAHYILAGDTVASKTKRFPADIDQDGIADVWEDSTGGRSLGFGSPPLDFAYDGEMTGGAKDGDGFFKIDEYTGVLIGTEHHRLRPDRLEVFYDIDRADSSRVVWAANQIKSQLNIHYRLVRGNNAKYGSWVGPRSLTWIGRIDSLGFRTGYHAVIDGTTKHVPPVGAQHERENALVINNNEYYSNGPRIDLIPSSPCISKPMSCQPAGNRGGLELGGTPNPISDGSSESTIYLETTANVFYKSPNEIGESFRHRFHYLIAETGADVEWTMEVDAITDVDSSGGLGTVNPFDHLSPTTGITNNDGVATVVATMTEDELLKRVTLHEMAHGFWIRNYNPASPCPQSVVTPMSCHPTFGPSVMRGGIGPAKTATFSSTDKSQLRLH